MTVFIWLFFIVGAAVNLWQLGRLDVRRIDFMDGVQIGQLYFITIPLAFFLVSGMSTMDDAHLTYRPFDDLQTTAILLTGMFLMPALRFLLPRYTANAPDRTDPALFAAVVVLFVVSAALSFQMSGLGGGGHWQQNIEAAFSSNPFFVFVKQASNVSRTVIFGLLVYLVATRRLSRPVAIGLGLALSVLDLMLTFNRITAVYLLLAVLLMLRSNLLRVVVAAFSLTLLSSVSVLWPMFRSFATRGGYSYESMQRAADMAAVNSGAGGLSESLNGVFESTNLVVLNWIVGHYGTVQQPYLGGEMFVRPATVLIPKSVWPGRPDGFGPQLGDAIMNVPSLALNSTLYGEAFANFGWIWPVALALFMAVCHLLFRVIAPQSRGMGLMAAFVAIAMWRFDSSFVGVAIIICAGMIGLLKLYRMARFRTYRRPFAPLRTGADPAP